MDRALFIAGSGARELMRAQGVQTNNLANALTTGFRQELAAQRTAPVVGGAGLPTRAYAVETTPGADFAPGPLMSTGRDLDVAVQGDGWFALQMPDGTEGYTRAGNFVIGNQGQLTDPNGRPVVGAAGPLEIPAGNRVIIADDGTVTAFPEDAPEQAQVVGQLKLVNPNPQSLVRGTDGMFRVQDGQAAEVDPGVRIAAGMLEGSNVNAVETLVNMISAARQYDLQVRMIQSVDQNAQAATRLLGPSGG